MYKTRKRFDGEEQEKSIDRLPDEILVHILSFVSSTRQCVRSSILAKRWRFLWARAPNLKFDSGDHNSVTSFSDFVYRFLIIHKGKKINTFRFQLIDGEYNKFGLETLSAAAIACNVKVIDIHSGFQLVLPECLFTSKTLVDLSLTCISKNDVPMVPLTGTSVYLPTLKNLILRDFRYESEESLVHLLSGCPSLEELTLRKGVDKMVCVYVSSPTLTRLDLEIEFDQGDPDGPDYNKIYEVKLDTPALKYLKFHDSLSQNFSTGMLSSLTEADIYFYDHDEDYGIPYSRSILEFVGKLNNVSCLKLNTVEMEVPDPGLTTEFRNLTNLEFSGNARLVTNFLEKSDNLKVLAISVYFNYRDWKEPKHVPVCMNYNLGTVRFDAFLCEEIEFKMIEYILRNARVLKRMVINVSCGGDDVLKTKYEALKRISLCERASVACQLVFD